MNRKRKIAIAKAAGITVIGLVMIFGMVGGDIFSSVRFNSENPDQVATGVSTEPVPCADPTKLVPEESRVYPKLTLIIDGAVRPIPKDIGVTPVCTRVIYTKDSSGTINVEPQDKRAYTLGNFFAVWGFPFSSKQVMDRVADQDDVVVMTVNGQRSTAFENLILHNGQDIVIGFTTIGEPPKSPFTVTIPGLQ